MTHLLMLSGSTRSASTNSAALRTAARLVPDGVRATVWDRLAELPAFNADDDGETLPAVVADLRAAIASADAVLVCTPEYAGTLPGSFKNLLDWTVGGGQFVGRPVTWLNVAQPGRGQGVLATLETVLGYVDARLLKEACASVFVARQALDAEGQITDPDTRAALRAWVLGVLEHL
jgi:NAD(P)H-dependent FMN reductase